MPAIIPTDQEDPLCGDMGPSQHSTGDNNSNTSESQRSARTLQRQHSLEQKLSTSSWMTIRAQREQEGRCGECGMQTHEFNQPSDTTLTPTKSPLTIENEVHRGRCLLCYPITSPDNEAVSGYSPASNKIRKAPSSPGSRRSPAKRRRVLPALDLSTDESSELFQRALSAVEDSCYDMVDILSAMRQFPAHRRIQELGCERLWILSWEDDNAMAIGHVGGIATIAVAMRAFPGSANLQQCACECLQNMALQDTNCLEICEYSDAASLIVEAMFHHPKVASLQHCGANALCSLAKVFDGTYKSILEDTGAVHALLMATRNFHDLNLASAVTEGLEAMGYDKTGRVTPPQHDSLNTLASEEPQERKPDIVDTVSTAAFS